MNPRLEMNKLIIPLNAPFIMRNLPTCPITCWLHHLVATNYYQFIPQRDKKIYISKD